MAYPDNIAGFDLGYVVGLFEGEGCITFYRHIRSRKGHQLTYRAAVVIANTNKKLLKKLVGIVGIGKVQLVNRPQKAGWKPCFEWRITAHADILWFLEQLFPHLVEKRDKAVPVMNFVRSRIALDAQNQSPRLRGYSDDEHICYTQFRAIARKVA